MNKLILTAIILLMQGGIGNGEEKEYPVYRRDIERIGGVDFSYLGGIANTLKRSIQQYIAQVQAKNREQAQASYEMIQQILRDLPDTARNRELMDEYYSLIEKIRATGEASIETRKRLSELTSASGAHIKTEVIALKRGRK